VCHFAWKCCDFEAGIAHFEPIIKHRRHYLLINLLRLLLDNCAIPHEPEVSSTHDIKANELFRRFA
jgi:hypothetical protein